MDSIPAKRVDGMWSIPSASAVAVIDIGSNSIRLVVFDGLKRVPATLFNEKVICRLGSEIHSTGRLPQPAIDLALTNLVRFNRMAEAMGVQKVSLLATAAARDAANGAQFLQEVEARCSRPVSLLTGEEEARLSALGVLSSLPNAEGVVGDLGGGSLELVELDKGAPDRLTTLRLGPLRFLDELKENRKAVRAEIDRALASVDWLESLKGSAFYAVGGAWRSLARLHMMQTKHPLHVIQGFRIRRKEAEDLTRLVSRLGDRSLLGITEISRRRVETLPYAALLLNRILKVAQPECVVFSAFGLREGFLFDQLEAKEREKDPLLFSAAELSRREGGFFDFAPEVNRWLDALFPEREPERDRLREAACYLSNIVWREHPDYRAILALQRILYHPFSGADHEVRAFLAQAVYTRYAGNGACQDSKNAFSLLSDERTRDAKAIGHALRLAYTLSAGRPQLLQRTTLRLEDDRIALALPDDGSLPVGEVVERRVKALANTLGVADAEIRSEPDLIAPAV